MIAAASHDAFYETTAQLIVLLTIVLGLQLYYFAPNIHGKNPIWAHVHAWIIAIASAAAVAWSLFQALEVLSGGAQDTADRRTLLTAITSAMFVGVVLVALFRRPPQREDSKRGEASTE